MVDDVVDFAGNLYSDYYQNQSDFDLDTIRQMLEEKILQSASPTNKQSTPCVTCGALVPLSNVSCMECINP